jgi:hypothetical protein
MSGSPVTSGTRSIMRATESSLTRSFPGAIKKGGAGKKAEQVQFPCRTLKRASELICGPS